MTALIDAAVALAALGMPVFPCAESKTPMTARGFHDASTDPVLIRAMFRRPGAALVGVPTGHGSGIVVIDGDMTPDVDGRATLREWTCAGRLPVTRTHGTRRGGVHLLFCQDVIAPLKCSASKIAPAVDTRGNGGFIIWWPASGGHVLHDMAIAALPIVPRWIVETVTPPRPALAEVRTLPRRERSSDRYAEAALRNAVERVGAARELTRNNTLFREAVGLARLIGNGLSASDIRSALTPAARVAGLPEYEVARTITSALSARTAAP